MDVKEEPSARNVILVIGMMRSGTSALTRVLSLCGCTLPEFVLGPQTWNPTGNWDPIDALALNTEFLISQDTALGDPTLRLQEISIDREESQRYVGRIQGFLQTSAPQTSML